MASCKDCLHFEVCKEYAGGLEQLLTFDNCENFKDRSRFVELPNNFPKGRLTTNKPLGNYDALMNYAYAKDGNVLIRYANGKENMDLCDYIAFHAKDCLIDSKDVLDGACLECDDYCCSLGRAYFASVQAATLRERLKMYEDLAEQALKEREKTSGDSPGGEG